MGGDERRSSNKDRRRPSGETKAGLYVPFKFQDGKVVDDAGNIYDVHEAAERIPWVTARQYPPPHQYVILNRCPKIDWEVLNCAISKHPDSYQAYFRGYQKPMRYWEFEGRRYWRSARALRMVRRLTCSTDAG